MAGMSQYLARKVEDAVLNGLSFSVDTAYLALMTTASTATTFGTEMTGGSYARQAISAAAASGNTIASDSNILFTNVPTATIAGVSIVDAPTGTANVLWYIDGLSVSTTSGDNVSVASGSLTVALT